MEQQPTPAPQPAPVRDPNAIDTAILTTYESNPFLLFKAAWEALKLNIVPWVLGGVALVGVIIVAAIVSVIFLIAAAHVHSTPLWIIGGLVTAAAVAAIIYALFRFAGMSTLILVASAKNQKTDFGKALEEGKPYCVRIVGYSFLYGLMMLIGFILLIVPGVLIMTWYSLGVFAIVDENLSIGQAFARSKQLTEGRFWDVFGVLTVPQVLNIFNIIPFVGAIISSVGTFIYAFALPVRYNTLKDYKASSKPLPPVSKWNYVMPALVVAVIALIVVVSVLTGQSNGSPTSSPYSTY